LGNPQAAKELAERGVTLFAMELIPRITRAQSMDVLSSMATISGYKAVLLAADRLPKLFPMMMTAAGTLTPAKVFVIGAGVAGLQAIASARRLGAVVQGYDVRPAVKEQVESLGAKFVEMPLATGDAEGAGGYAKQLDEEFYRKQRELMAQTVAASDVCITTAAIPGKKSPVLVTADAVRGMAPGSVIVDLAAERGGNCELTRADETVVENGVTILGPTNLPSEVPTHASQMYAKNLTNFMALVSREGKVHLNLEDQVVRETLAAHRGEVVNPRMRELLDLPPLATPSPDSPPVDHLAQK
jgi:NAD(P) transhydrogenase subunit alpha